MEILTNPVIQVQLIDFPKGNETVTKNEDDSYTIFINAKLNCEQQKEAYIHALKHIKGNDFDKEDVGRIEYFAHNMECSLEMYV